MIRSTQRSCRRAVMALLLLAISLPADGRAAETAETAPEAPVVHPGNAVLEQLRKQFDRNLNGALDPAERDAAQAWLMKRYDTNHDGQLEPNELRALLPSAAKSLPSKTREGRQAAQPGAEPSSGLDAVAESAADELGQSVVDALQALDANGDGQLDAGERRKAEAYLRRLRSRERSTPPRSGSR